MRTTIKELFGKYEGHPILVIGGGPSVRRDLPRLVELGVQPACVISANSHGMLQSTFPVDFIVHVDKRHAGLQMWMKDHLAPYGKPLISRHAYADYRLPDLNFPANSGLMAVLVAATLGGNPTIVTGIDCWAGGREYFHDSGQRTYDMPRPRSGAVRPSAYAVQRSVELKRESGGSRIRPVSGPFTELFPPFNPDEPWRWWRKTDYRARIERLDCGQYSADRGFQFTSGDRVSEGSIVALSPAEAEKFPVTRLAPDTPAPV